MDYRFEKATKSKSKLRLAIDGVPGSGKTYTALVAAKTLGGKTAVIDTERGSASLYSDEFNFDVLELNTFSPQVFIDAITSAEEAGYNNIVIDSLSHAWEGEGGALDMVDEAAKRSQSGNTFNAWKNITPLQRKLFDTMLQSPANIIATMRSKMEYVQEKDERTGKLMPKKIGLAPVQRQGTEYEFTIVCDMDTDHNMIVSKSRCKVVADKVVNKPDHKFFQIIIDWLNSGADVDAPKVEKPVTVTEKPAEQAKTARPYDPETLKAKIAQFSASNKETFSDHDRNMVAMLLDKLFDDKDPEPKRHAITEYLTGESSTKKLSDGYIHALKMWLSPRTENGILIPNPFSVKEAQTLWTEAQKANGQQELL